MSKRVCLFTSIILLAGSAILGAAGLLNEPEGIVYDSVYNRYLISNWRSGTVVQVDSNGVQSYFRTGLGNCASIIISGDVVYVPCNNNSVYGLDLVTGATVMYRNFPGVTSCHDVAVDTSGYLYATDWPGDRIFRVDLSDNSYVSFAGYTEGLRAPIGIEYDIFQNRLIVTSFEENQPIRAVSLPDGVVSDIVNPGLPQLDGVARDHLGNYYISTFTGGLNAIYRFDSTFDYPPQLIKDGLNGLTDVCYNRQDNILGTTVYWDHDAYYYPMYGYPFITDHLFSDDSNGDGDGVPEGGETVDLIIDLTNTGVAPISDLALSITVDDPSLNIISGTAVIGDIPVQGTVDNSADPFVIDIPPGYLPRIATFMVEATWESEFGEEIDTLAIKVNIGGCSILLVDDDNNDHIDSYFTDYFDQASIPYDIRGSSPAPTPAELNAYEIVIWFTGSLLSQPLDGDEIDAMSVFMNSGGKLFLTGQYIASDLNTYYPDFLNNYLRSEYLSSSLIPVLEGQSGAQVLDSSDKVSIYGSGGAYNQISPGHVSAINGGVGELHYSGQSDLGAVSYDGTYKLVFFAFGFEAIVDGDSRYTERAVIMSEILNFFGYQRPSVPMTVTVSPGDPSHLTDHTPVISWENGDPGYDQDSYQVQVGNDNDWTSAEMWDYGPVTGTETNAIYAGIELIDGATYYFRVRVYDGVVWSNWYYEQMRMNSLPTAPTGLTPDNMLEIEETVPVLSHTNALDAEGDLLTYTYELYDDNLMSSLVAQESDYPQDPGTATVWEVTAALPDGGDYFWRVRAGDGFEYGEWSDLASFFIIAGYVCGDANGDETVNVGDAVFIINYVFSGGPAPERLEAGDANADGQCNVGDAVYLINYVFGGGPEPQCP